jgi:hypothetical protein
MCLFPLFFILSPYAHILSFTANFQLLNLLASFSKYSKQNLQLLFFFGGGVEEMGFEIRASSLQSRYSTV